MKIKEYFAKLKEDMAPMTFPQKVEHIWTYNKEIILVSAFFLMLAIMFISAVIGNNQEVLLSGYLVNVVTDEEGTAYLSDGFFDHLGGTDDQKVEMYSGLYKIEGSVDELETSYALSTRIAANVSAQALDYLITDELALRVFISFEVYMDLSEFFTAAELEALGDKIIYAQPEGTNEKYPIAVNISDTAFVKDCVGEKQVFIGFIANTPHMENCREFWDYIHSWESKNEK